MRRWPPASESSTRAADTFVGYIMVMVATPQPLGGGAPDRGEVLLDRKTITINGDVEAAMAKLKGSFKRKGFVIDMQQPDLHHHLQQIARV